MILWLIIAFWLGGCIGATIGWIVHARLTKAQEDIETLNRLI